MESIEKSPSDAGRLKFTSLVFELLYELYTNFRTTLGSKQIQHSSCLLYTSRENNFRVEKIKYYHQYYDDSTLFFFYYLCYLRYY